MPPLKLPWAELQLRHKLQFLPLLHYNDRMQDKCIHNMLSIFKGVFDRRIQTLGPTFALGANLLKRNNYICQKKLQFHYNYSHFQSFHTLHAVKL